MRYEKGINCSPQATMQRAAVVALSPLLGPVFGPIVAGNALNAQCLANEANERQPAQEPQQVPVQK